MSGIDSVLEPMGEEDIASTERWNKREQEIDDLCSALATVLDAVDYQSGACAITDRVGAVLPTEILELARAAVDTRKKR